MQLKNNKDMFTHGILLIATTVFSISLICSVLACNGVIAIYSYSEKNKVDTELSLYDNGYQICRFEENKWSALDNDEKLLLLKLTANIEAAELGIPEPPDVKICLLDENVLGSYDYLTNTISVDSEYFEENGSGWELCETILHESFHAYQRLEIELFNNTEKKYAGMYLFKNANVYKYEFANYQQGDTDFFRYYNQLCEKEARRYAGDRYADYRTVSYEVTCGD